MPKKTRRYSIRISDIKAKRDVIFTAVDWTDEEKRAAVKQVVRWTGVPDGVGQNFADMIAPPRPRNEDFLTSLMTSPGDIESMTFLIAS